MNIHEYQSKELLKRFGCPVSKGLPATTEDEAKKAIKELSGPTYVVKAQIHAGGRGKGRFKNAPASSQGGVRLAKTKEEALLFAREMLGGTLVTQQTGLEGKRVNRIYIEEAASIKREYYLSLLVDRSRACVAFVVSTEGGTSIEDVAHATPEKIATIPVDPVTGVMPHHARAVARALNIDHVLDAELFAEIQAIVPRLYAAFVKMDMTLLEVNPLIVTDDDRLTCLDAKISFDTNAFFRHPELPELRDLDEEDPREIEASAYDLSYIALTGSIGCMVNGAGLAMATMDIIKLYGETPANFLDVGGGASQDQVSAAFKIITSDENVKGILINIFGGIMRCDVIAKGVVSAAKEVSLKVPLVVRLEGTNADEGKEILEQSDLNILSAGDLDEAAQKIVKAVRG